MDPNRNEHPQFIGLELLKAKQNEQLMQFEEWAAHKDWIRFHASHYDWWMFPISKPSQFGFAYTVYELEIEQLKKDNEYKTKYLRGVELLMLSWGWDLKNETLVDAADEQQAWHNWPIRLNKCARSLQEFGFEKEFESVKKYAHLLIEQGISFSYNGRDLSVLFK